MAIKGISHDESGQPITKVPVVYKVALGLPKGYRKSPQAAPLSHPEKLFHFMIQSRDPKTGEWVEDQEKTAELFREKDKPREIPIRLLGNDIDQMLQSSLFYWSNQEGAKCSRDSEDSYLRSWCERYGLSWEIGSQIQSEADLELLKKDESLAEADREKLSELHSASKAIVKKYNDAIQQQLEMPVVDRELKNSYQDYSFSVTDYLQSKIATRKIHGEYRDYPCAFRQCPDFATGRCMHDGKFFFIFEDDDVGDVAHLVTTSPKNVQQIRWGLEKVIKPYAKNGIIHGVRCRLVGTPTRGKYSSDSGYQADTTFFLVQLKGPERNSKKSIEMIQADSQEMAEILGTETIEFDFDEGDERQIARERLNEFNPDHVPTISEAAAATQTTKPVDLQDDSRAPNSNGGYERSVNRHQEKQQQEEASRGEEAYELYSWVKTRLEKDELYIDEPELQHMILVLAKALDQLPRSGGRDRLVDATERAVVEGEMSLEKLLKAQMMLTQLGSKVNLADELEAYRTVEETAEESATETEEELTTEEE